ncbi:PREDICTED: E3 ubiquitin-protein ligase Topors [Nanorana parkeri]|uniref:E3 ubiquitin-protein ligase Topors n=1 Tax=Nanorana parkeri TaxID=125878 RepID=UPI0008543449|nr:PREDICTED: E3 ubiquitin-protein ligase Topors [Nanorana parkeri]
MREKRSRRRRTGRKEESGTTMQSTSTDDFIGASSSKAVSRKSHNKGSPADVSPDSKCPICLDRFENISHLDRCLHRFCFKCIKEWAKNKAECPLCKQPFHSIFHSVRAEDDFKEYVLRPTLNGSFGSPDGQRFRYRTTMTRENQLPSQLPMRTLRSSAHRTFSPTDNGVLFEGYTNRPSRQRGSNIQQMMRRLASRRQASAEGRAMRQIQEQELVNFRRALYRSGMHVRNIQDGGRYRDISAEFFRRNPACLHRLVPWLKRELTVLFGTHGSLVNIVQHIIMSNVTRYDMESRAFLEDLQPFLLHRTEHFLHEFINFARCPYNMDAYDQHANYDCPAPSYEEGSESESSVITISPDEVNTGEPDMPSSSIEVGQSLWDDETPGPSYSTVEQATSSVLTTVDSSDEEPSSSRLDSPHLNTTTTDVIQSQIIPTDDCIIVGYVKPLAERTPELVELSSDSEPSLCEVKLEQAKKPQETPFTLYDSSESHRSSSASSQSSDKQSPKIKQKLKTSSDKSHLKKKKEKRPTDASRRWLESRKDEKDERHSYNEGTSRRRERSLSSDCYSRSSRNKACDGHKKWHTKSKQRTKTREKKHKIWREGKRSRSRDRSSSWRSRTVSLSSESSRELNGSNLRNRKRSKGRSQSRDNDNIDSYRSTYHWEYTYYSRNRDREEFQKSYKRHSSGRGDCSRYSISPDYHLQTFSQRKESRKLRETNVDKRNYQSRSRSNSRATTACALQTQSDKPGGKRKYKTRHLEPQNKSKCETEVTNGKEEHTQTAQGESKDNLMAKSSNEPKLKLRKKTRSPSVEIVYEGKCTQDAKRHKKKKKKHKKKRRREQSSPVVIRIDSDSDTSMRLGVPNSNDVTRPGKSDSVESNVALLSDLPTPSTPVNTIDGDCEAASPYSKACNLPSVNEYLDSSTDILDGLFFGESLDGQAFLPAHSPTKTSSLLDETAVSGLPISDSKLEQDRETSTTPPITTASQETIAENPQEMFAQTVCEHLQTMPSIASPPTASEESTEENSQVIFAETVCEHLEDMVEHLSPTIL